MSSTPDVRHPADLPLAPSADRDRPPPRVGMVGGGQLARMSHQASIALGVPLSVLAATEDDAAAQVSPAIALGDPTDGDDLTRFAATCDVLTYDHELVDLDSLARLESAGTVSRPPASALTFATDKAHQRRRFAAAGLPLPRHHITTDRAAALDAAEELGWPAVVKTARGGYDGRGVWVLDDRAATEELLDELATATGQLPEILVEAAVAIVREMAVIVVRGHHGEMRSYPVTETVQVDGICRETITPARLDPATSARAQQIAEQAAEEAGAVGLIAVELFWDGHEVTINEVATRPHNSGHWTIEGAVTSQFENHIRAVAGLPLGDTSTLAAVTVTANVLGHADGRDPRHRLGDALAVEGAAVHLYGKGPRPGRKLGHVTVLADDLAHARSRAHAAVAALGDPVPEVER